MPDRDIDIPPIDAVSIAELSGHVVHITGSDDPALFQYVRAEGVLYPVLKMPYAFSDPTDVVFPVAHLREVVHSKQDSEIFEDSLTSLLSRLQLVSWMSNESAQKLSNAISFVLSKVQALRKQVPRAPSARYQPGDLLESSPLRGLAWHSSRQVIALAHRQDSIHIYDLISEKWLPPPPSGLRHEYQKSVTAVEWNPQVSTLLAASSKFGVCLWRLIFDPTPEKNYDQHGVPDFVDDALGCYGWMNLLRFPQCEEITTISWSPDGRFLAAASGTSSTLLIWDVALETATPFRRRGHGTTSLAWSPDGQYLIHCTDVIRIYETRTWAFETLNTQKLRPHSVCWMPDSRMFMFAVETGRSIVVQQLNRPAPALEIKHVTRLRMPDFYSETHDSSIGGKIKAMVLDSTGKRLAVSFDGYHRGAELIALFSLTNRPLPEIEPIGYIRGPQWHPNAPQPQPPRSPYQRAAFTTSTTSDFPSSPVEHDDTNAAATPPVPMIMKFAPEFKRGALLTVAWENGQVQFVPIYIR
ncbi:hypothetical protein PhCBS80983_g05781 [Powellomyces hirtus]|uniref:Aladin seven-bladed propeller domain-containing protein n=1 Tax=Powellomyces hirtus TaxID=109895 RepID=A0A507DTG3_9FUNG|nr:hypothetical protein PhCBS80983_g05781 [Powellomyces hirtus]